MGARKAVGESGEIGKISTVEGRITVDGKDLDSPERKKPVEGNEFALVNVGKKQNSKKGRSSALFFVHFVYFGKGQGQRQRQRQGQE